ncbi:MAG TPA: divalent-cation tolerance protein CutA [Mariprofundaceae bacterium]|nr:divalent-cation tolerance protein CutA [Mariprofundaceae bacterium]
MSIILTSVDSDERAKNMAKSLIESGLAACVQISAPGISIYRWDASVQEEQEFYLSIKTTAQGRAAACAWLDKFHPYETPEIVCLEANASSAYMKWLRDNVQ